MKQIFLVGAYGQNNLGDEALLAIFAHQLRDAKIIVNSAQPEVTERSYGVSALGTYWRWPRWKHLRMAARSDAIIFGGGSLLKEIEGGTLARLLYFVRILLLLLWGKLLGRPTLMLGVGIGPLQQPIYRWLARLAAALVDLLCVRDQASADLLQAIGVRRAVHVVADPVFMWEAITTSQPHRTAPVVAVIPRYSLAAAQLHALAGLCDSLVEQYGARIRLLPFQSGYRHNYDDLAAAETIRSHMRHSEAASIAIADDPNSTLNAIAGADLLISARLHGLIFAANQHVPMIAIDYEVKVGNLMRELGLAWASVTPDALTAPQFSATVARAWTERASTRTLLAARATELREQARQTFTLARALLDRPRQPSLLTGGSLLFASMMAVNLGNYLVNLVLGRWLGPRAFADVSLVVTLFLLLTIVTGTLQTLSAKWSATFAANNEDAQVVAFWQWLARRSWLAGVVLGTLCAAGAPLWQQFFHTSSPWLFVVLAACLPIYFALGTDRGVLQGRTSFASLAASYQIEMWVRLVATIGLVAMGWAVFGALAGLALSLALTWTFGTRVLAPLRQTPTEPLPPAARQQVLAFAGPVLLALIGQVLISNSDVLLVKHFFAAEQAGQYAALALIGRVVFFATASVVAAMFPIVAQRHRRGEPHRSLLWLGLGLVAFVSVGIVGATLLVPNQIIGVLFGAAYLPVAPLLWLYALATAMYALANVVVNYRLATERGGASIAVVVAGLAQVGGIWIWHQSLRAAVLVQVLLMIVLLMFLLSSELKSVVGQRGVFARITRRRRQILYGIATAFVLLLMWRTVRADTPEVSHPAQQQIQQILPALINSEAEHASGAYIPGMGAVLTLDLVRGPNTLPDKTMAEGTRDWAVYLMQTFGSQLSAVPAGERIAISIDFYDFANAVYHQLVITAPAGSAADSSTYALWLDGAPYTTAAATPNTPPVATLPAPTAALQPQPPAAPLATAVPVAAPAATAVPAPTSAPIAANGTLNFDDAASTNYWKVIGGTWQVANQSYEQTDLGKYDLVSMYQQPITGDYTFEADVTFVEGNMGAGLVFNAPSPDQKAGAQMVSFAGDGVYVQWGSFDQGGVFQFQNGTTVPNGADKAKHRLRVDVRGNTYSLALDGKLLAQSIPLASHGPYIGLFASTSHVIFNNVTVTSANGK